MTRRETRELFDRIKNYPKSKRYFILLEYVIKNNEFEAINIRKCINYLIKTNEISDYDFGNGCNFLHFLIIFYNNKDHVHFISLLECLDNIFYDFLFDDNNEFKLKPINLGFNKKFCNKNTIKNILLILFFIKNKENYDEFNRNIFFDMYVWQTIFHLIKLKIDNDEVKKIENILYKRNQREKLFNHFLYPL